MGEYGSYLRELLGPLGVYRLEENTVSGAELTALGLALDRAAEDLETAEREALTATAEGEGLRRREALFARRSAAVTPEQRRAAIAALLQIDGDSLTPGAISTTLGGCGIRARALETPIPGRIRVIFPEVAGQPEGFAQIKKIVDDIIPCHLETEYYFRYMTWGECEARGITWRMAQGKTWEEFQSWV